MSLMTAGIIQHSGGGGIGVPTSGVWEGSSAVSGVQQSNGAGIGVPGGTDGGGIPGIPASSVHMGNGAGIGFLANASGGDILASGVQLGDGAIGVAADSSGGSLPINGSPQGMGSVPAFGALRVVPNLAIVAGGSCVRLFH